MALIDAGTPAAILVDADQAPGVARAVADMRAVLGWVRTSRHRIDRPGAARSGSGRSIRAWPSGASC
ncbi:hypothetical protein [Sphingosinicella terrae]|uniref:hypothetical protein n=1 Tax=Sphingosinicella terrae TaxID=2172047 RepID=UPI000E0DCDA8|nr:hypothetical protein [Sphingosinicella terrae]